MKKKILFFSPLPPPNYGSALSSKMCLDILKTDPNFEVLSIQLNFSREMKDVGRLRPEKFFKLLLIARQTFQIMIKFCPDIIYFMPATSSLGLIRDYFFLKIIRLLKRGKLVLHIRTQIIWGNILKSLILKDLLNCDKVIVLGQELVGNLKNIVEEHKVFILPNAIPSTVSDAEYGTIFMNRNKSNDLKLLFISAMWQSKGWLNLLKSCQLLGKIGISYTCHFVGEWPSKHECDLFCNFIEIHNLHKDIFFYGFLEGKEKSERFKEANVFILPTENDACPRVILEAMEYGLPIISTRIGAIPSLIKDGNSGYILDTNSPQEIAESILKLNDKNTREIIGNEGRRRFMNDFTYDRYKNKFINILTN